MATVTFKKDITVNTSGQLPAVGSVAPEFVLVKNDLSEVSLKDLRGKTVILNIFPTLAHVLHLFADSIKRLQLFQTQLSWLFLPIFLLLQDVSVLQKVLKM